MSSIPQASVLYPQQVSTQTSSHHSNGSYGPVFAVLAVITVLAVSACFIGRLCARRICQPRARVERGFYKGDIENSFASTIPANKLARGKSEAAWHGGEKGEDAAKHAEIKGAKAESYAVGNAGTKASA